MHQETCKRKNRKISLTNGTSDCVSMHSLVARTQTSLPSLEVTIPFIFSLVTDHVTTFPWGQGEKVAQIVPASVYCILHWMIPQSKIHLMISWSILSVAFTAGISWISQFGYNPALCTVIDLQILSISNLEMSNGCFQASGIKMNCCAVEGNEAVVPESCSWLYRCSGWEVSPVSSL